MDKHVSMSPQGTGARAVAQWLEATIPLTASVGDAVAAHLLAASTLIVVTLTKQAMASGVPTEIKQALDLQAYLRSALKDWPQPIDVKLANKTLAQQKKKLGLVKQLDDSLT